MAVSKPTYQYIIKINYPYSLNYYFRALAYILGCFPLDLGPSHPKSVCFLIKNSIISFTNFKEAY